MRLDRQHRAGHVGDMGHRDELGAGRQQRLELRHVEPAGRVDRRDHQLEADAVAQQLPRHDVGVMLELGDHDLVAGFQEAPGPSYGRRG